MSAGLSNAVFGEPPHVWYQRAQTDPGFKVDSAQAHAIERLQQLYDQLIEFKAKRQRLFGKSLLPQPILPRGVYFWGGVGRGKSWLMDRFYAGLPYQRKRRVHFHAFMQDVHQQLQHNKNKTDPLVRVAENIAERTRVLCFDEFHVSDIADAMILQRLFDQLFARGVVMLLTSNYPPDELYPNGLQRSNFLPAIALLKQKLDVINVDSGVDYRRRPLTRADVYLCPNSDANRAQLERMFDRFSQGTVETKPLTLFGRVFAPIKRAPGVIWFNFAELCENARAQMDYLELTKHYPVIILSDIPVMSAQHAAAARRFTWLVDVLYDQRIKLLVMAGADPESLYPTGEFAHEFVRIASRLGEMASEEYLAESQRQSVVMG